MNSKDNIERAIRGMKFHTRPDADERIMKDALAAMEQTYTTKPNTTRASVWRIIMTNKWTRIASAAAAIIAIAVVAVTMLNRSASQAYAIEQTVEANRGLQFVHLRIEPAKGGLSEAWAEFGNNGELLRGRLVFPKTEDGPKDTVWEADKAQVLTKKSFMTVREPNVVARMGNSFKLFTPTVVVDQLLKSTARGEVKIETGVSQDGKAEIRLTVQQAPDLRTVYHVAPDTKLLQRIEKIKGQAGNETLESQVDYLDYNQPPAVDVFTLNPPADVMRIDETTQVIGLPKGNLTDEQITVKVVREFFEALMAKDYAKAGQLFSGLPAARMEQIFGKMKILSIGSIGVPKPHWIPGVGGMVVSCKVQVEIEGKQGVQEFKPAVRPVYSQPDNWTIHGGI